MKQFELGDKDFNEASIILEIRSAIDRVGYDNRYYVVTDKQYERYLQTLVKYRKDPRFAKEIEPILSYRNM